VKDIVITFLRVWRSYVSPLYSWTNCCKYQPSCCNYAIEACEKHGILRGAIASAWRVARCNPFSKGGYDPVK